MHAARPAALPLLTARLRLRELREEDIDGLFELYTHPLVAPWIGAHTREDVAVEVSFHIAHQRHAGYSLWAVEDRASGRLIGDCGLQPLEMRGPEVELGYELHPETWGRGLASEAARATVAAGLGPLGLERIMAVVKHENARSRRVLANAGLRESGVRVAYGQELLLYEIARGATAAAP